MALPKYTKRTVALDILSLVFVVIFIGVGIYDPNAKIHDPNGNLTIPGIIISVDIVPFIAGIIWLSFRYIDIICSLLQFRSLGKFYELLFPIILIIILLSQIIKKD